MLQQKYKLSSSAINISVNAVRFYYSEVINRPLTLEKVERPKSERSLPNVLSEKDIKRIITSTENLKHKAILTLIYSGGLRISELINLRISDIKSDRNMLLIRGGKGRKDRYTLLSAKGLDFLRTYYKTYHPKEFLFEGQHGGRYSETSIRKILKASMEKAKVNQKATVHTLRHSFAICNASAGTRHRSEVYPGTIGTQLE